MFPLKRSYPPLRALRSAPQPARLRSVRFGAACTYITLFPLMRGRYLKHCDWPIHDPLLSTSPSSASVKKQRKTTGKRRSLLKRTARAETFRIILVLHCMLRCNLQIICTRLNMYLYVSRYFDSIIVDPSFLKSYYTVIIV